VGDKNAEQIAWDEAKAGGVKLGRFLYDRLHSYVTTALSKWVAIGTVGVVLAGMSLPVAAVVCCGVAVLGGVVWGVFGHRIAHRERASRRWTWIAAHRLKQDKLRGAQALDGAMFTLMGRQPPTGTGVAHPPHELREAMAVRRHYALEARKAQSATGRGDPRPAPKGPNLDVVAARMKARKAEIDALDAEIQSLAVPANADAALAADDARRYAKSAADAAQEADKAARDRARRGQPATRRDPGTMLNVTIGPTGARSVSHRPGATTPEQIAAGERTDQAGS
jgi:hypothetical protein